MENTQGITKIIFTRSIRPFCPLGKDTYQATVTVFFEPNKELFDFCEADTKIQALSGGSYIVEDIAAEVYAIMQQYSPKLLSVKVEGDSNKHFPVTVWKE